MKRAAIAVVILILGFGNSTSARMTRQQPVQADPGQAVPKPAPRPLTFTQRMKQYLQRTGATTDDSRGSAEMVVSNYPDPKGGRTTIVLVNDRRRNLVGFYIYNFGNVKEVKNKEEVLRYLLNTNDEITIGTFFVDSEDDVGYKYLVNSQATLTPAAFELIYLTMAAVARERKGEIRKLLGLPAGREDTPSEVKKAAEGKPPGTRN
jgi:hypothetical protein